MPQVPHFAARQTPSNPPSPNSSSTLTATAPLLACAGRKYNAAAPTADITDLPKLTEEVKTAIAGWESGHLPKVELPPPAKDEPS